MDMNGSAFERAVDAIGGWAELGRRCGVTSQAANKWKVRVPREQVKNIVRALEKKIEPHDLLPDDYPPGFQFPDAMLQPPGDPKPSPSDGGALESEAA